MKNFNGFKDLIFFLNRRLKRILKLIRAGALFMFDEGKNTKEVTRVISLSNPEDAMTQQTCEPFFAKFREGDRSLQDLPRTEPPQILDWQSLKAQESCIKKYWKAARRLIATYTVFSLSESIKSLSRMASIRQRLGFSMITTDPMSRS